MSISTDTKYLRLISSRLRNFKQKGDNLFNFSCNYCGDSQKNKLKARGYTFQKAGGLFYKCFNCSVSTTVGNLIKHTDAAMYNEYIMERYKSGESGNSNYKKPVFDIPTPKFGKVEIKKEFESAEWLSNLPSEHFCIQYATKRQIPLNFYDKLLFTPHYNQFVTTLIPNHGKQLLDDARLVIPFYNEYNELIAVSGRALETNNKILRYVTIRTNNSEDKLLYGMDRVNLSEPVKIVEGPFDSLFLNNCLASGDANLAIAAKNVHAEKKVLIYDNEKRNKQIVKMMQDAIKLGHDVVIWPDHLEGKDINEMILSGISIGEIERIISSNTFSGLEAQTRFTFWKKV